LPPFIVTLGMWQIVLAANFLYSANETIRSQDIAAEAPVLQFLGNKLRLAAPSSRYGVIFMVCCSFSVLCAQAHGVGAPCLCRGRRSRGRATVRRQRQAHADLGLCCRGLICAFAGWALIGRIGSVSPTSGQLGNIESITAVVIGGISLFGGRGSIMGALFGALIVGVFTLGLRLLGADAQWTFLLIGVLIIAAVAVDQWIRKVAA
jgi:fructose transport system permease protein